jgi:hypothetical protein
MRKLRLTLLIAFVLTMFYGCSKNNNKNNSSPTSTQWTYNDTTYFGVSTFYDTTGKPLTLESEDDKGNKILLQFNSRPTENSTYKAVENVYDSVSTNPYVSIYIYKNSAPSDTTYESSGKPGDVVNTTIIDGKLHAVFSNITISAFSNYETASGTVIQTEY